MKKIFRIIIALVLMLQFSIPINAQNEKESKLMEVSNMPIATVINNDVNINLNSYDDLKDLSEKEIANKLRENIVEVLKLQESGCSIIWNLEYVDKYIKNDYPDLYSKIDLNQKIVVNNKQSGIGLFAANARGFSIELRHLSANMLLHVDSKFQINWDGMGNIVISMARYSTYPDSVAVFSGEGKAYQNGSPNASIDFSYLFSNDALIRYESIIMKYTPRIDGSYTAERLY